MDTFFSLRVWSPETPLFAAWPTHTIYTAPQEYKPDHCFQTKPDRTPKNSGNARDVPALPNTETFRFRSTSPCSLQIHLITFLVLNWLGGLPSGKIKLRANCAGGFCWRWSFKWPQSVFYLDSAGKLDWDTQILRIQCGPIIVNVSFLFWLFFFFLSSSPYWFFNWVESWKKPESKLQPNLPLGEKMCLEWTLSAPHPMNCTPITEKLSGLWPSLTPSNPNSEVSGRWGKSAHPGMSWWSPAQLLLHPSLFSSPFNRQSLHLQSMPQNKSKPPNQKGKD